VTVRNNRVWGFNVIIVGYGLLLEWWRKMVQIGVTVGNNRLWVFNVIIIGYGLLLEWWRKMV
jgi:hypothetical protein